MAGEWGGCHREGTRKRWSVGGKGVRCAGVSTDRRNNSIVRLVEFLVLTFVFRFALFLFCLFVIVFVFVLRLPCPLFVALHCR